MAKYKAYEEHLIVDGFNIAHAWPHIEPLFSSGLEGVIEQLTKDLREVHDEKQIRVTIVLDGKGNSIEVVRPFKDASFSLLYSPESHTADAVIEQFASSSKTPDCIIVASRDQFVLDSIEASGARGISPETLLEWVERSSRDRKSAFERQREKSEKSWGNRLPL